MYIEAPNEYLGAESKIFLAGGITDSPDWQDDASRILLTSPLLNGGVAVYNPRRADFPINDPSAAPAQIDWEYRYLHLADVILFWFPKSKSVQPIALYELGRYVALNNARVVVGCDSEYPRRLDVVEQMKRAKPRMIIHDTLYDSCVDVIAGYGQA